MPAASLDRPCCCSVRVAACSCLVNLAFLLWIGLTDSQPGDNRFGPNPKGQ